MERIVPWQALCAVIAPYYPKAGNGRPPIGLERMLRIHFLQDWFNLANLACEEALYDSPGLRCFVGIDLGREPVPDATTLLKFWHLLERHQLGELFVEAGRPMYMISTLCCSCYMGTKNGCMATTPIRGRQHKSSPRRRRQKTSPTNGYAAARTYRLTKSDGQTHQIESAGEGRTCVSGGQATVGLHQGALSGTGQECQPCLHGAGQPLPGASSAHGRGAPNRVRKTGGTYLIDASGWYAQPWRR